MVRSFVVIPIAFRGDLIPEVVQFLRPASALLVSAALADKTGYQDGVQVGSRDVRRHDHAAIKAPFTR